MIFYVQCCICRDLPVNLRKDTVGTADDNSEHNGKLGGRKHGVSESDSVDGGHGPSRKAVQYYPG